jgi:hypothetical protein
MFLENFTLTDVAVSGGTILPSHADGNGRRYCGAASNNDGEGQVLRFLFSTPKRSFGFLSRAAAP